MRPSSILLTPRKYKITLDQLRMAARNASPKQRNPCAAEVERIVNAFEAADYNIAPVYKYVKDLERCYEKYDFEDRKKGRASTLYYLSQYLDQQKNKTK